MLGYISLSSNSFIDLCSKAKDAIVYKKRSFFSRNVSEEEQEILDYINKFEGLEGSDNIQINIEDFLKLRNFCKKYKLI